MKIKDILFMQNTIRKGTALLLALVLSVGGAGCKVLLPAHPNSNARKGESVTIRMLDHNMMTQYTNDYFAAFGAKLPPKPLFVPEARPMVVPLATAAVSVLVGLAVDYVQQELQKEASLYEAQFGTAIADDKFWIKTGPNTNPPISSITVVNRDVATYEERTVGTNSEPRITSRKGETIREVNQFASVNYSQNYYGFEVVRSIEGIECFRAVFGLAPSADRQFFRIAPLYFQAKRTKAKILSDTALSYLPPWTWPGKLIKSDGHHVDASVAIEIRGFWKDKTQEARIASVAASEFSFAGYDIGSRPEWRASDKLKGASSGWLLGVPFSLQPDGEIVDTDYAGTFTVKATVTEKDPSNAKQDLEKAATLVAAQKEKIIERIK